MNDTGNFPSRAVRSDVLHIECKDISSSREQPGFYDNIFQSAIFQIMPNTSLRVVFCHIDDSEGRENKEGILGWL